MSAVEVQAPDTKPGRYYVTTIDDTGRVGYLLGPFVQISVGPQAHARALSRVRDAKDYVQERFPRASWWSFGTMRVDLDAPEPVGKLNEVLGGEVY